MHVLVAASLSLIVADCSNSNVLTSHTTIGGKYEVQMSFNNLTAQTNE